MSASVGCGKLLCGRFPSMLKGAVYYVRPAILYVSEVWCQKESEMNLTKDIEMVRAMYGVQLNDKKRPKNYVDVGFE